MDWLYCGLLCVGAMKTHSVAPCRSLLLKPHRLPLPKLRLLQHPSPHPRSPRLRPLLRRPRRHRHPRLLPPRLPLPSPHRKLLPHRHHPNLAANLRTFSARNLSTTATTSPSPSVWTPSVSSAEECAKETSTCGATTRIQSITSALTASLWNASTARTPAVSAMMTMSKKIAYLRR